MADRKAELEKKKAKLAAMREEKKRKDDEKKKLDASNGGAAAGGADLRTEAEDILRTLGIAPVGDTPAATPGTPGEAGGTTDAGALSPKMSMMASPKRQRKLQMGKVSHTTIAPKEAEAYCKETQTHIVEQNGTPYDEAAREDDLDARAALVELQKMQQSMVQAKEEEELKEQEKKLREFSEEEKAEIMLSDDFQRFFGRSTRLMERAIDEPFDIFTDYSGADREENEGDSQRRQLVKMNRDFFDERWSRHRVVTDLDWSTIFPELMVASYNTNEDAPHEPDGVCLVWNIKYRKSTPEYIFHCQSPVTSATFATFHPNMIIGGTYSGQIVLWDNRTNKRTPVQRTPLSASAHTHPVYSVLVAGTQNAHNLLSLSSDGKLCSWSLDMLAQPQESMELQYKQSKSVAATCLAFLANDVNNFVVGSEEGAVYTGCRHGSKAGLGDSFEGHQGPVTGVDAHSTPGPIDFSHLFLSSSFDWTVKLWSVREQRPLYSFEDNSEYVYDTAWSPIHPAVFATVDGAGRLDVWNLNNDPEVPSARVLMDNQAALNKCRWHSSGLHIAVGDNMGRIRLFDLNEQLASPRPDEWTQFAHTIAELRSTSADQREDENSSLALR